jgi:putative transcriptional regulator
MAEKLKINRLKVVLAEKDMSHKDFAKMMKKTPNTITRICNNEQQPSLKMLRAMAITLDVDISELLVPTKPRR